MRNKEAEIIANRTATRVEIFLGIKKTDNTKIGIILGTGWGDALTLSEVGSMDLKNLPGFLAMTELEGHSRILHYATIANKKALILSGRIHMNESLNLAEIAKMVRLQVEMLISLGVETLILCSAVGSLTYSIKAGDVVVADGFVSLFAPPLPLYGGEFYSPEDTLDSRLIQIAVHAGNSAGMRMHTAGHVMVRGPHFEGRKYDKLFLASTGAGVVGMSMLPEAAVAALYHPHVKVLGLGFVTNSATEKHSHAANIERAKKESQKLGRLLEAIVEEI